MAKKKLENDSNRFIISSINQASIVTEQYRTIRTNLEFQMLDSKLKVLLVTSAEAAAGKPTLLANLAVVFAQQEKRVLLIDADLRRPTVHVAFQVDNRVGLTTVLSKQIEVEQALQPTRIVRNLAVLTAGPTPPNPAELLSSNSMKDLISRVSQSFDVILIDAPPVVAVTDAQILSRITDGVIVVAKANQTKKANLNLAKKRLNQVQANILGCVLTGYEAAETPYYGVD